jgi:hypothetical protein
MSGNSYPESFFRKLRTPFEGFGVGPKLGIRSVLGPPNSNYQAPNTYQVEQRFYTSSDNNLGGPEIME